MPAMSTWAPSISELSESQHQIWWSDSDKSTSPARIRALEIARQARHQCLRLAEGKQVTAGNLLGLHAQAFLRDPTLEFIGEEPVITTREDGDRDVWPAGESKAGLE